MTSLTPLTCSDHQCVSEFSGDQRRDLCCPLWLSQFAQAVRQPTLLHVGELQKPRRQSKTKQTETNLAVLLECFREGSLLRAFDVVSKVSSQDHTENGPQRTRSVLLISDRNARHVVGVLRYLGRTSSLLPHELLTFAQGVHLAREEQKTDRPLCSYLKSFGVCR